MGELVQRIREWMSKLTGLQESGFAEKTLEEKFAALQQWHGAKVVADNMVLLLTAQIMAEHGVSARDTTVYVQSSESRESPLGRVNAMTGIGEWPTVVASTFLPLLECRGYRPFIRKDCARAILDLCAGSELANAGLDPGNVADALYRRGLTPRVATRTLKTFRDLARLHPDMAVEQLKAFSALRESAAETIIDLPNVESRLDTEPPQESD